MTFLDRVISGIMERLDSNTLIVIIIIAVLIGIFFALAKYMDDQTKKIEKQTGNSKS